VHVLSLLKDCSVWARLSEGGAANIRRYFSAESARRRVLRALRSVGLGPHEVGAAPDPARCAGTYDAAVAAVAAVSQD
jgi:hypothetical protein